MSGVGVNAYLESYSRRLWSGARSCSRLDLTLPPKMLAVLEEFDKTRAAISELIEAAEEVLDSGASWNSGALAARQRLRSALAEVCPTPTPKEPT